MTTVPRADAPAIEFFRTHIPVWAERADRLGLSDQEIEALTEAAEAAKAAYAAMERARQASQAATTAFHTEMDILRQRGAAALLRIRAQAASEQAAGTGEADQVLSEAAIPPSPIRREALPPASPERIEAAVIGAGQIRLTWRIRHTRQTRATGTLYTIERRTTSPSGPPAAWTYLGAAANRRWFIDSTVPGPTSTHPIAGVEYRITPRRAGVTGEPGQIQGITFGALPPPPPAPEAMTAPARKAA